MYSSYTVKLHMFVITSLFQFFVQRVMSEKLLKCSMGGCRSSSSQNDILLHIIWIIWNGNNM